MNVLIISGEYPSESAGGIGTVVHHLSTGLQAKGIHHKVICTKEFETENENVVFLNSSGISPVHEMTFGRSFKKFIEKEIDNWDVLNFQLPNAAGPLMYSSKKIKDKSLVTVHTTAEGYKRFLYSKIPLRYLSWKEKLLKLGYVRVYAALERKALKDVEVIAAGSDGVKSEIENWYNKSNVHILNNGVSVDNLHYEERLGNEVPKILYVGRLAAQKGIFYGIQALEGIDADYEFLVVGTGQLRNQLENYCKKLNVNATFLGFVDETQLYKLYSTSDILLMPSLYEGLPMVGIEGAGCGLPIAAFEEARIREVVCEENRELISPTRNVDSLKNTIERLLEDSDFRQIVGKKNRENVLNNFTLEKMVDNYIKMFESIP